ncbi:hypothetical protein BDE02_13G099900 [Populus trichocarpa]|nr:hypothetical protein BDE02_13G099900 [Populus trichocarpa]
MHVMKSCLYRWSAVQCETFHDLLSTKTNLKRRILMARQIVEGLRFIHTNQFVHRDLATKYIFVGAFQDEKEIKIEDFGISEQFKFECESNLINLSFYCSKLIVYFLLIFFWQRYFVRKVKKFKLTLKETKVKRLLREKDPSMQKQIYTVCELLCSCCCTLTISGTERK